MKKKKPPAWLRWLYLAMAAFIPFAAWMDFRQYRQYRAWGIYSEDRWIEVMDGFHFRWVTYGFMVACWLYLFFVMTWDKDSSRDHDLPDGIFSTVLLLSWACLPLLISIPDGAWGLWVIVLAAFIVVIGRSWVKYFENKHQEEEYYE